MKKIKQAQEQERNDERLSQKSLYQDAVVTEKTRFCFYTQLLQVMQVPLHRIALPDVNLPIFQPPKLG
jgi:hypothetical protein